MTNQKALVAFYKNNEHRRKIEWIYARYDVEFNIIIPCYFFFSTPVFASELIFSNFMI